MLTRCPNCSTVFRVNDEQIDSGDGDVRCCICDTVFNVEENSAEPPRDDSETNDHISEDTPAESIITQAYSDYVQDEDNTESEAYQTSADDISEQTTIDESILSPEEQAQFEEEIADIPNTTDEEHDHKAHHTHELEQQLLAEAQFANRKTWPWLIGALILGVVLALQVVIWKRHELAMSPKWANSIQSLCNTVGCEISKLTNVKAIKLIERHVGPHESNKTILVIEGKLINKASFAQPFPNVDFTLKTTSGALVGSRVFFPNEYLQNQDTAPNDMQPGQVYPLKFEVMDPEQQGQQFEFRFY